MARDRILVKDQNGTGPEDKDYKPLIEFMLALEYVVRFPDPSLKINGHRMLSPGEYGCICGLPGSGKTAIVEEIITAFLKHKYSLDINTNGIEAKTIEGGNCVLLDTERSPDDNRVSLARIEAKIGAETNGLIGEIRRRGKELDKRTLPLPFGGST